MRDGTLLLGQNKSATGPAMRNVPWMFYIDIVVEVDRYYYGQITLDFHLSYSCYIRKIRQCLSEILTAAANSGAGGEAAREGCTCVEGVKLPWVWDLFGLGKTISSVEISPKRSSVVNRRVF